MQILIANTQNKLIMIKDTNEISTGKKEQPESHTRNFYASKYKNIQRLKVIFLAWYSHLLTEMEVSRHPF